MAYSKIKYEVENGVALITLADPATLNAISVEMTGELTDAFARAVADARCVVLTGEGRGFSSGANLASGAPPLDAEGQPDLGARLETTFNPFVCVLRDLPIPYVTAVNGVAAGIGCSFALLGDLIVAGESAYFLQAFRRIGLVPDGSATYHLPRMIGRARAMEMMLLGEKIPAQTALDWGLVNRVVADADVLTTAKALAVELANGPKALGMIRRLAWASLDNTWNEQLHAERQAQRVAGASDDFREGVQAFFGKRPANFKGS
jgi:2-(1,2-epoxy-1,2-dihydrophenyl)acetyl-CoA isomerase